MPRFVILRHDHPELHWDLMLEANVALRTWRLPAPPTSQPTAARALGDHRLAYLDYEGPVSGNRGEVKHWDAGVYEMIEQSATSWVVRLLGQRWRGTLTLTLLCDQDWATAFKEEADAGRSG